MFPFSPIVPPPVSHLLQPPARFPASATAEKIAALAAWIFISAAAFALCGPGGGAAIAILTGVALIPFLKIDDPMIIDCTPARVHRTYEFTHFLPERDPSLLRTRRVAQAPYSIRPPGSATHHPAAARRHVPVGTGALIPPLFTREEQSARRQPPGHVPVGTGRDKHE